MAFKLANLETCCFRHHFDKLIIFSVQDIMNFTEYEKAKGYFLFIDFEKAFDSIEWNFRFKSLETFNFGN